MVAEKERQEAELLNIIRTCGPYDVISVAINQNGKTWSVHVERHEKTTIALI